MRTNLGEEKKTGGRQSLWYVTKEARAGRAAEEHSRIRDCEEKIKESSREKWYLSGKLVLQPTRERERRVQKGKLWLEEDGFLFLIFFFFFF